MLHFIPDRLIPGSICGKKRLYLNESASLFLLFSFCLLYSWGVEDIHRGIMPEWWTENVIKYLKGFPCPFCGATRSMLYLCRGAFSEAAHYSFFGCFFFFSGLVDMLGKLIFVFVHPASCLEKYLFIWGRFTIFTTVVFGLWGIQLLLHYTGIFTWYALAFS